ncbi:class I SAM-dependent methyltransferase [Sphingomonas jatrophae]|uniref:SAM-dependent methyltransferase, MidA family n=1 Tax=Sphingomonas jatrophae TaxID=1166337 RepID=A0A1I6LM31_9SPHN|nr:SAM-dependent methyltransferase [Sphingomonas jatrophae]SFS04534.1 SAM-dependent methyltransferase, MidA family [Sphingomonas jatrophae]
MPASPDLADSLRARVDAAGAIPLAAWMAACNAHYYATRDPLGRGGDFITAPEISQMFGELIGLWAANLAGRAGVADFAWVELGPGRGTLTADALRAMARAGLKPPVHFVETSPVLRRAQAERVPDAVWHDSVGSLPADRPLIVVGNEFVDALPIVQMVNGRERMVRLEGGRFAADPLDGEVIETCPAGVAIVAALAERIARRGGALLLIDYGHAGPVTGDTLQAVRGHRFADPFADPGEADLTAHVDFTPLLAAARAAGCAASGPVGQGAFLESLGLGPRAAMLARAQPARTEEIVLARARLAEADQMGTLFKVIAAVAPGWPMPAGF